LTGTRSSLLQKLPILAGLSVDQIEELESALRPRRYQKGEVVFHRDDPGDSLYIIDDGAVRIGLTSSDGREVTLTVLGTGGFFGELALLDGEPRSADAVAVEPTRLLRLQRETFLRFLEGHPATAPVLLATMSRQIRRLTDQVYDAAFLDLPSRLAKAILNLAVAAGGGPDGVSLRLTQTELASMVGATRESVNKWLRFYQRRGIIRLGRGTIAVLRMKELEDHATSYSYV